MSSHSYLVQKALLFLDEQMRVNSKKDLTSLCDEAGMRFNLSPLEVDSLYRIFKEEHNTLS